MPGNCSLSCPILTSLMHDGTQFTCSFTEWFYGLAAAFICIGGLLPIALVICLWVKLKNAATENTRKLLRQESEASTHTDVSRPHDHSVYEVLTDHQSQDIFFRTRKGVFPHQKYGTFSVPDFRRIDEDRCSNWVYPGVTQVHSPPAFHASQSSLSSDERYTGRLKGRSRGDAVPKRLARKRRRNQHSRDDLSCSADSKSIKFSGKGDKTPRTSIKSKQSNLVCHNQESSTNELLNPSCSSLDGIWIKENRSTPILVSSDSQPHCWRSAAKDEFTTEATRSLSFLPTPPVKHLAERTDFDLYLMDCAGKLPEDQRNGTFLIRDSQSEVGSKVLVVYCKGLDPSKTLYHYKICSTEDGQVYLQGSMEMFSSLNDLIAMMRTRMTPLPCLLANCIGKHF